MGHRGGADPGETGHLGDGHPGRAAWWVGVDIGHRRRLLGSLPLPSDSSTAGFRPRCGYADRGGVLDTRQRRFVGYQDFAKTISSGARGARGTRALHDGRAARAAGPGPRPPAGAAPGRRALARVLRDGLRAGRQRATHLLNGVPETLRPGSAFLLTPADFHRIDTTSDEPLTCLNVVIDPAVLEEQLLGLLASTAGWSAWPAWTLGNFDEAADGLPAAVGRVAGFPTGCGRPHRRARRLHPHRVRPALRGRRSARPVEPDRQHLLAGLRHRQGGALRRPPLPRAAHARPRSRRRRTCRRTTSASASGSSRGCRSRRTCSSGGCASRVRCWRPPTSVSREVCHAAGFNSPSHFGRAYRRRYGESPRAARAVHNDWAASRAGGACIA